MNSCPNILVHCTRSPAVSQRPSQRSDVRQTRTGARLPSPERQKRRVRSQHPSQATRHRHKQQNKGTEQEATNRESRIPDMSPRRASASHARGLHATVSIIGASPDLYWVRLSAPVRCAVAISLKRPPPRIGRWAQQQPAATTELDARGLHATVSV